MFADVTTTEIESVLAALKAGRVSLPLNPQSLDRIGANEFHRHLATVALFDARTLPILLSSLLEERSRRPPTPELVWTGPEGPAANARRTEVIFRHLLASATREVWMAGYSIDHGQRIFAPLHEAMVQRNVRARFILHPSYQKGERRQSSIEAGANLIINRFLANNWPFPPPRPEIFYDARPLERRPQASMHIKAVVVDDARVLIGSANFTDAGQQRNYEAGAYIDDPQFAKRLAYQLASLIEGGLVSRYGDSA